MATTKKKTTTNKPTKADLEAKIADLEAKLNKLAASTQAAQTAPKPAETKPAPKPAETAPKPAETKPAPKPAETAPPKPAETAPPVPLHERFREIPTGNWNQRKSVTGYTAPGDRYWGSRALAAQIQVAPSNWNDQKTKITGYTAPGNKYFATKQRLAYHSVKGRFGAWVIDAPASGQAKAAPTPKDPKEVYAAEMKAKGKTLPKGF
jgi:hypothetical protein